MPAFRLISQLENTILMMQHYDIEIPTELPFLEAVCSDMDNVYFSVLEDDFQYKVDVNTITKHPVNTNTVVDETDEDNTNSTSTILENAPEGWTRYSNEDFGLTFIYPNQSSSYR